MQLARKVALITGTSPNIGGGIAAGMADEGAKVVCVDVQPDYANRTGKSGLLHFTRSVTVELAPRVRVNGVAPGGVQTDLRGLAALGQSEQSHWATPGIDWEERLRTSSPLQLVIQPQDLASAYVLLASRENARAMTGVIVHVDAGSSLRMPRQS